MSEPEQLKLFADGEPGQARRDHGWTSKRAAAEAARFSGTQRSRVLGCITNAREYGATDSEMQIILDMNPSTQRPRRVELVRAGLVADSGRTRPTLSGRAAVVWVRS